MIADVHRVFPNVFDIVLITRIQWINKINGNLSAIDGHNITCENWFKWSGDLRVSVSSVPLLAVSPSTTSIDKT